MHDSATLEALIDEIAAQTREMLAAAHDNNWDRLIQLERARRGYFSDWAKRKQQGQVTPESCRDQLLAIQAMDGEIRQRAGARFSLLQDEIALTVRRQKLARHYHGS